MANNLKIEGEIASKGYPLRTTPSIFDSLSKEADDSGESINLIINKVLFQWHKKRKKSSSKK